MRKLFFALIITLQATSSFAALGGTAVSASSELTEQGTKALVLSANTPQQLTVTGVTLHQTLTPTGTQIREYINADGIVFAIAWNGPTLPNLKQLLGNYFQQLSAPTTAHTGLRNTSIRSSDVVIQSHGHMRAFQGRAFIPALMPSTVQENQIQ